MTKLGASLHPSRECRISCRWAALKGNPTDEVRPEGYQIEVPPVDPNPKTKAMRNSPEYIHTEERIYHHFTTTSELRCSIWRITPTTQIMRCFRFFKNATNRWETYFAEVEGPLTLEHLCPYQGQRIYVHPLYLWSYPPHACKQICHHANFQLHHNCIQKQMCVFSH